MLSLDKFLWKFVNLFPEKVDVIHTSNQPYLLRFHLKHCGLLPGVYLHYFYRSDSDRHLHNHPWQNSRSLILTGGYEEQRQRPHESKKLIRRVFVPGMINKLDQDDYHQITLLSAKTWTLFVSRKKNQIWGFWADDKFIPYYEYQDAHEGTYVTDLRGKRKELSEQ